MMTISPLRRFGVALASLVCAAVLFRSNVASSLVTRGDDVLRAGDAGAAIRYYGRAVRVDFRSAVAADRLAFALLTRRQAGDAARAQDAADGALSATPRDPALLADRAFAARQLSRWLEAERDFAAAASLARDPRYAHLAAQMARRAGDRDSERAHLKAALAIDAAYAPARALLARLHS
jgi:tetratricopeptide (TPR) repeat protein